MSKSSLLVVIHLCFLCCSGGCATWKGMAIDPGQKTLDISKDSVALMTVRLANEDHRSFQPYILQVFVAAASDDDKGKHYWFFTGKPFKDVWQQYTEYHISMQLPPGKYLLRWIHATGSITGTYPPLLQLRIGHCFVPVETTFIVKAQSITYLGHIGGVIRKRNSNSEEVPAGSVLPLADQAITGFYSDTFDITISDKWETDFAAFKREYPVISQCDIEKAIMPPWERPKKSSYDLEKMSH